MKVAHVRIQDHAVQVEVLRNPSFAKKPVVIGGRPDEAGHVYACSPAARQAGVRIGMKLRQAEQLSPGAVFLPTDEEAYLGAHRKLLTRLSAYSPIRQTVQLGEVAFEASGLEGLVGPDDHLAASLCTTIRQECSLLAAVGIASNRFTASIAARRSPLAQGLCVRRGEEATFLAPLEISVLPASEEAQAFLVQLGLTTIGQVAALPSGALSRTLGREGARLHRLARGIDPTPLIPEFEQSPLSASVTFDWQLDQLPALIAYTEVLLGQLSDELQVAGLAAGNVIVEVEQENGLRRTAWGYLRPASSDRKKLFDRAAGLLEAMDYSAGVTGLSVLLTPLEPAHLGARQMLIGNGNALTADPLGHTLRTIRVRFGDGSIRDAAAIPGPPPEPVEVQLGSSGTPISISYRGRKSRIAQVQLHWRLEGDWWWGGVGEGAAPGAYDQFLAKPRPAEASAGRKDYYQVVTRTGEILVLLDWDNRWYLHPAAKPSQWPAV